MANRSRSLIQDVDNYFIPRLVQTSPATPQKLFDTSFDQIPDTMPTNIENLDFKLRYGVWHIGCGITECQVRSNYPPLRFISLENDSQWFVLIESVSTALDWNSQIVFKGEHWCQSILHSGDPDNTALTRAIKNTLEDDGC